MAGGDNNEFLSLDLTIRADGRASRIFYISGGGVDFRHCFSFEDTYLGVKLQT